MSEPREPPHALFLRARSDYEPSPERLATVRERVLSGASSPLPAELDLAPPTVLRAASFGWRRSLVLCCAGLLAAGSGVWLAQRTPTVGPAVPVSMSVDVARPKSAPTPTITPLAADGGVHEAGEIAPPVRVHAAAAMPAAHVTPTPTREDPLGPEFDWPDGLPERSLGDLFATAPAASHANSDKSAARRDSLAGEVALLSVARQALAKQNGDAAERALTQYRVQFPAGQLAAERATLDTALCCARGDAECARARFAELVLLSSHGAAANSLRKSCAGLLALD